MIYFDSDILIHILIPQDAHKHDKARDLYESTLRERKFCISLLCLQEVAFVLHKLGKQKKDIEGMLSTLLKFQPVSYTISEMQRGVELAKRIGFQNINDCIHLAIAERHCSELYTFNSADFKKLAEYSELKIKLLK